VFLLLPMLSPCFAKPERIAFVSLTFAGSLNFLCCCLAANVLHFQGFAGISVFRCILFSEVVFYFAQPLADVFMLFSVNRCIYLSLARRWSSCVYLLLAGGNVLTVGGLQVFRCVYWMCLFLRSALSRSPCQYFSFVSLSHPFLAVLFGIGSLFYYPPMYSVLQFWFSLVVFLYLVGLFFF